VRVLMLHNRYLLHGGEDISYATDVALLRRAGHEVQTMEEHNERIRHLGSLRAAARTVWSQEAFTRVRRELRQQPYDIMHVQNFFPLISPSVYYAARAEGVAVVQSLRNYRLLCPGRDLFRDGRPCELCLGKRIPWPGVAHACYRGSRAATGAVAAMLSIHRVARTWARCVDRYIALTRFGREKFIEGGLPAGRIMVRSNTVYPDPGAGPGGGGFAVFVGRLEEQKGIRTLLHAWRRLGRKLPLTIIGDGPLASLAEEAMKSQTGITWLGSLPSRETLEVVGNADLLVFCSQSYEGQPRVIAEAYARGTPVIAPRLGAMIEMVEEGLTGRLYRPQDPESIAEQVNALVADQAALLKMREAARRSFEQKFNPEATADLLVQIYRAAAWAHQKPPDSLSGGASQ
jgi:glycosyltransferase involved in cell wall biosynthesis